jgi:hypothetical protein
MGSPRELSLPSLPNELWRELLYHTTFVPYEIDIWAKAHVRLHFRKMPLHLTTGAIPRVYKDKYSLCLSLMRVSKTWKALITPLLYSFAVIYGDDMLEKFMNSVERRPFLLKYVRGLILLATNWMWRCPRYLAAPGLIERLPNLRTLHQPYTIISHSAHYRHTLISMGSYFCHQLPDPSALRNLRTLTISATRYQTPPPFFDHCITLPALVALDVGYLENPVMFECITRWKMPILGILCASTFMDHPLLYSMLHSVFPCLYYLQLRCSGLIAPWRGVETEAPNLRELIFVIDGENSITPGWLEALYPLPCLRKISITEAPGHSEHPVALQHLLNTLEYVIKMKGKPPQLEMVRVWEEGQWSSETIVDPTHHYRQLIEYEKRNAFGGAELKVIMPDSGVYERPTTAYQEAVSLYGGDGRSDSEDYESYSDDIGSDEV